jgi:hypothetical protein
MLKPYERARAERYAEGDLDDAMRWTAMMGGDERRYAVALLARRLKRTTEEIEDRLIDIAFGERD